MSGMLLLALNGDIMEACVHDVLCLRCQTITKYPPIYGKTYIEVIPTPIMAIIDGGNYVTIGQYPCFSIPFQLFINLFAPACCVDLPAT